jgi:hypothetical protein
MAFTEEPPVNESERQLDLEVAGLRDEVSRLRSQLSIALEDGMRLRHRLEHIYAISQLAFSPGAGHGAYETPAADEGSTPD